MPKVDLKLYTTDAAEGKKQTTTVTYVNPDVSNDVLKSFAQQLNSFTTNTYASADRVETVNVDTEATNHLFRNLAITGAVKNAVATITCNSYQNEPAFTPAVFFYTSSGGTVQFLQVTTETRSDPTQAKFTVQVPNAVGWLYAGITAKTDYYSDFISVAIN